MEDYNHSLQATSRREAIANYPKQQLQSAKQLTSVSCRAYLSHFYRAIVIVGRLREYTGFPLRKSLWIRKIQPQVFLSLTLSSLNNECS